jgi:hypothetical protein
MKRIRLVNDLNTQRKGERVTGFYTTKKVVAWASKEATVKRLGLTEDVKFLVPKYVMVGGVPHKMKDGNLVPLKKLK